MKRFVLHLTSLLLAHALLCTSTLAGTTERVSVSSFGVQDNSDSYWPSISADGRYVAFSYGDYDYYASDVLVRDRLTGTTERVSVSSSGELANCDVFWPSVSADGRYVAFASYASNLVPGDTNGEYDVFVRDRVTGTTERVSVSSSGAQGNDLSNGASLSADGRYVAFESDASNLVPGDTNGECDVFVRDRVTGTTERVSVSSLGEQGNYDSYRPSFSADGRYVAFHSYASNLVPGDTNGSWDVFVRDRVTGMTERVSVSSSGAQANDHSHGASFSADGRYVAFHSYASNLVPGDTNGEYDVFVRDRVTGTTERVSVSSSGAQGNDLSYGASVSADGRYVAFASYASDLVPGDTNGSLDVFVRDRLKGTTERMNVSSSGAQGNGDSYCPSLSADGRYVAFQSLASNLVPGDTNGACDVFVRDRADQVTGVVHSGWNLISVPIDPIDPDPLRVFQGIDVPNASFQFWKNDAGGFQIYGSSFGWTGPIVRGTPYWLLNQGGPVAISYAGYAPAADFQLGVPAHSSAPHWIAFGTPSPTAIYCGNVRFLNSAVSPNPKHWAEAYTLGMVESKALFFDPDTGVFRSAGVESTYPDSTNLQPWLGYWLLVNRPEALTITFPKP